MCAVDSRRLLLVIERNPFTPMVIDQRDDQHHDQHLDQREPRPAGPAGRAGRFCRRVAVTIAPLFLACGLSTLTAPRNLMSSGVPSCLSGPAEEMSAASVSWVPGQWKMRSLPQGSLALLRSRYFCDTRSSIAARAVAGVVHHVLRRRVAGRLDPQARRRDLRLLEVPEHRRADASRQQRDDGQHDHDLEQSEAGLDGPRRSPDDSSALLFDYAHLDSPHCTKFCMSMMG